MHKFKEVLSRKEIAYGSFCALKDPAIIEIFAYAGFDFAIIDLEHSALDKSTMEHFIRAAQAADISSIVRITGQEYGTILRAVEAGADGIIFPHVLNKEQCQRVVNEAKYFPIGRRGMDGSTRAAKYGNVPMVEHMRLQNERLLVIAMIEDVEGVENLDEILSVNGLDLLFIGAADLSCSFGLPHQVTHPKVREAIKTVFKKANQAGKKAGAPAYDAVQAKEIADLGAGFITSPAVDTYHLTETLKAHLAKVKAANR